MVVMIIGFIDHFKKDMNKRDTRGFTLIELLVVIAIIGILSSVVLASLNTARNKGADAAAKEQLATIRPQAEIYYDSNSNYGTNATTTCTSATCAAGTGMFSDPTVANQLRGAYSTEGSPVLYAAYSTGWAVAVQLKGGGAWCVDNTGASKATANIVAGTFTTTPANWTTGCN